MCTAYMRDGQRILRASIALGIALSLAAPSAIADSEWTATKGALSATLHVGTPSGLQARITGQRAGAKTTFVLRLGTCAKPGTIIFQTLKIAAGNGVADFGGNLTAAQQKKLTLPVIITVGAVCAPFSRVVAQPTSTPTAPQGTPTQTATPTASATSTPTASSTPTTMPSPSPTVTPIGDYAVDATLPVCPPDLAGVLTDAFVDPAVLTGITPLGNVGPPGHVAPVDHNYFATTSTDRIVIYAPAKAHLMSVLSTENRNADGTFSFNSLGFSLGLCRGVAIHIHGLQGPSEAIAAAMAAAHPSCGYVDPKIGHVNDYGSRQCTYDLNVSVTSGETIGWTQAAPSVHGLALALELTGTNHNVTPEPTLNWDYYGHAANFMWAFCALDMYKGALKDSYYSKFGLFTDDPTRPEIPRFVPRTMEPRCGQVNQNIMNSAQGTWFEGEADKTFDFEAKGQALSLIHWNIDPSLAIFATNGGIVPDPLSQQITPVHTGTIDREPSEIHADGKVYCYNITAGSTADQGRILVQLLDNKHADFEHQSGACTANSAFVTQLHYQR